jgi:putative PEP-CTERM system TPR-repeat lipoprotein
VPFLKKAVAASPHDPMPEIVLATYYLSQKNYTAAEATVTRALKIAPNSEEATALLGQIQFAKGAKDQASATFRRVANKLPQSPGAQILLANALAATKNNSGALSAYSHAVELDPTSIQARDALINFSIRTKQPERALNAAEDYRKNYPGPKADILLAQTMAKLKKLDDAKTLLTKSFAAQPNPGTLIALSRTLQATGDRKKALSLLSDWVKKHPDNVDVRREYGSLLLTSGDNANARSQFEAILKTRPYDVVSLNNVSWLLQKSDPKRAIALASLAAKIQPQSAVIVDTLGWLKWQNNAKQEAVGLLQRAHHLNSHDPEIAYHYAVALSGTGKHDQAMAILKPLVDSGVKFDDMEAAKRLAAGK